MVDCPFAIHQDGRGQGLGSGFLHEAVLSGSLSINSKMHLGNLCLLNMSAFLKDAAKWVGKPRIGVTIYYNFSSYIIWQVIYPLLF